ncbi:MAG: carboxylating nicotinate-nucleotide diphosphorylase [Promethearchaeota archaeon]
MTGLNSSYVETMLRAFLEEDNRFWDVTSEIVPDKSGLAIIRAKNLGIVAGIPFAEQLFQILGLEIIETIPEGTEVKLGDEILRAQGKASQILIGERTALNILMRLSGIATYTNKCVQKVRNAGYKTKIAGTRKTTPGFRIFEKYAIKIGGGDPHRFALDTSILIKNNHLKLFDNVTTAINKAKKTASFVIKIEIEVETKEQALEAVKAEADIILLDNFSPEEMKEVVSEIRALNLTQPILEASGGITIDNIVDYAATGVDVISLGILTHSAPVLDLSLSLSI